MVSAILSIIRTRLIPSRVAYNMLSKAIAPIPIPTHTCTGMDWDMDGPSPSEYCVGCQHSMRAYHTKCMAELATSEVSIPTQADIDRWSKVRDDIELGKQLVEDNDVDGLMTYDLARGINRPWWFYGEMYDVKYGAAETYSEQRMREDAVKFAALCEETQAAAEAMKLDLRVYIDSQDSREVWVREKDFAKWLATPKNKRPIIMANGRTMAGVAKADTGSVVIKGCPVEVKLCDIRTMMAKFGGVRDVYRPTDRATGAAKPFVFVEMLRNADAWTAADYFTATPCVLDGRTLAVSGAGERKTSTEMAEAVGFVAPKVEEVVEAPKAQAKQAKKVKKIGTGAFAALADSDSE
jgi:hypothetical protein